MTEAGHAPVMIMMHYIGTEILTQFYSGPNPNSDATYPTVIKVVMLTFLKNWNYFRVISYVEAAVYRKSKYLSLIYMNKDRHWNDSGKND